jgi:hypothetical protein
VSVQCRIARHGVAVVALIAWNAGCKGNETAAPNLGGRQAQPETSIPAASPTSIPKIVPGSAPWIGLLLSGICAEQSPRALAAALGGTIKPTESAVSWAVTVKAPGIDLLLDAPTATSPTQGALLVFDTAHSLKLEDLVGVLGAYHHVRDGKVASATFVRNQNSRSVLLTAYVLSGKPAPAALVTKIAILSEQRDAAVGGAAKTGG